MWVRIVPDDVNFKVADMTPREGQRWDLRPDNPVPVGWILDKDHVLHRLDDAGGGAGVGWDSPGAAADRILAEARADGWSPAKKSGFVPCRSCTPCRNRQPDRCIRPNSPVAFAEHARRARQQAENELEKLLTTYGHASSISLVESAEQRMVQLHRLNTLSAKRGL
jgi:hypothetical protein